MRLFSTRSRIIKILYVPASLAVLYFTVDKFITAMDAARSNSALFKSVMYHLRNDEKAAELLGDKIRRADGSRWVYGKINMIAGNADFEFEVQGERAKGKVYFKGHRIEDGDWSSSQYKLISGNRVIEY